MEEKTMRKSLGRNALLNAFRQSSALLFQLVTFPYVSRVLGIAAYGRYSFSFSVVSYFLLLSCFGISNFAVREGARVRDDRKKVSALVSDLLTVNLITMGLAYAMLGIVVILIPEFRSNFFLIAIQSGSMLLSAIGLDYVNIIYEDYLYITVRYVMLQIISGFLIFLLVREPQDVGVYCAIMLIGSYGGNLLNLMYVRRYVTARPRFSSRIFQYFRPLLSLFGNAIATTIYVNCDITMLGFYYSDGVVGVYGFASKLYNMLKMFINSIVAVATPRLAYLRESDEAMYWKNVKQIAKFLFMILLPVAVFGAVFSGTLIRVIGGTEYQPGSLSFQILMIALVFALLASVFSNGILIINRMENHCLFSTIVSATINVTLNFILLPRCGISGAAITTVVAELTNLVLQSYFCRYMLRFSSLIGIKDVLASMAGCVPVVLICLAVEHTIPTSSAFIGIIKVCIGATFAAITYILTLKIIFRLWRH